LLGSLIRREVSSVNPATGDLIETFALHSPAEIEERLAAAKAAQEAWAEKSFAERAVPMRRAAAYLREHKARFALHATREMGKRLADAEAEIEKCASACEFYAEKAAQFLADETVASSASESYIAYQPLGVVLAVMPWNFPFWQVFRFAAPALMAGNAGILKHASNVTRCALDIEEIFEKSGLPAGLFSTVIVRGDEVKHLIADDRIAAVTLTGSEAAGVSVASESGRALKKTVLELGGSDAFIVLADADVDAAAQTGARARFQNAGQSCICAKRFIVERAVYDRFVQVFVNEVTALVTGNPEDPATTIGPLARTDLRDELAELVARSVHMGARVLTGGGVPSGPGAFLEPTVLVDVTPEMPVFREETFGPVAAIIVAEDADHAVRLANDSIFGLGGCALDRRRRTRQTDRAKD
jgi:acyl-CoA reductase-like NAD-dependent aldehyde dehydrogenase